MSKASNITFSFDDKVVLLVGASGSIGKAVAELFLSAGASVSLLANKNTDSLKQFIDETGSKAGQYLISACDITNVSSVEAAVSHTAVTFGRIDFLVNCAGVYIDGDEWNLDEEAWRNTIDINLIGAMNVSKAVGKLFVKQKYGVIVNVASRFSTTGFYDAVAYSASKAGLVSLTQSYARLLAPFGRANAVSPSAVNGGYWLRASKEEIEKNQKTNPMQKFVEPVEVATLIAYLCSEESAMITGQNISMDGGFAFR